MRNWNKANPSDTVRVLLYTSRLEGAFRKRQKLGNCFERCYFLLNVRAFFYEDRCSYDGSVFFKVLTNRICISFHCLRITFANSKSLNYHIFLLNILTQSWVKNAFIWKINNRNLCHVLTNICMKHCFKVPNFNPQQVLPLYIIIHHARMLSINTVIFQLF